MHLCPTIDQACTCLMVSCSKAMRVPSLSKRKDTLKISLNLFLPLLRKDCTISNCSPDHDDLKHFLVWKDDFGKTPVHKNKLYIFRY